MKGRRQGSLEPSGRRWGSESQGSALVQLGSVWRAEVRPTLALGIQNYGPTFLQI